MLIFNIQSYSQTVFTNKTSLINTSTNVILETKVEITQFIFDSNYVIFNYNGKVTVYNVLFISTKDNITTYQTLNSEKNIIYFHLNDVNVGMNDGINTFIIIYEIYLK